MKLRLLGVESGKNGCPALYATDRGTFVVQGKLVTDEGLADLKKALPELQTDYREI